MGKSAPRVAVFEGHEEAYDDDLVSDRGEMSDLEVDEEEQDLCKYVMPPRVAVLDVRAGHNGGGAIEQSEEVLDPEDYAKEILYEEEEIDEAVVKRLFDLLPNQRFPREIADSEVIKMRQKAWASGVYRHGGVLGLRNSSKEFPYSTRLIKLYIQKKLGLDATWSTFSLHENLNVKRHRDSHNARDRYSHLIPVTDFKEGGLWMQLRPQENAEESGVVIMDGRRVVCTLSTLRRGSRT